MKNITIKKIIITGLVFALSLIIATQFLSKSKFLKSFLTFENKKLIKKYVLPFRYIDEQEARIKELQSEPYMTELRFKKSKKNIHVAKMKDILLSNNKILKSYNLTEGFFSGVYNYVPGNGYIDFHKNNLIILSARGVLAYTDNVDQLIFTQIENNINDFIDIDQFAQNRAFSLKDIMINKDKIFISYTEEIKKNCWNTSVIYGNIDYKNIKFNKLFSSKECINPHKNLFDSFKPSESGGRIVSFDIDNILLTIGTYRHSFLAQKKESVNGKIIKINIHNSEYKFISMGHRNPQGLYFDKDKNFILETEHGPQGGDEINLIEVEKINKNKILNYGWPISSAGEHYGGKVKANQSLYEKYPLHKSHNQYGFIEPLKTFVPSIGISEITKIATNKYAISSLRDKSLYFIEINDKKEISNLERIEVFERIRDINFKDNKLYLFLEDTASIGVIQLN